MKKVILSLGGDQVKIRVAKGGTKKKLSQNIGFLYSKWPYRSNGLIKKRISPQMRNGAKIYIKDCQNLAVWFGCGILEGFYQMSRPPDKFEGWFLKKSVLMICTVVLNTKNLYSETIFLGSPPSRPGFWPGHPPSLKLLFSILFFKSCFIIYQYIIITVRTNSKCIFVIFTTP